MSKLGALYQLARADFLERTRTFQYLAMVGITLWAGALLAPPKSANYIAFAIDGYRGIYNSAWMGIMFALVMTSMLSLFGYYLIKSAVQRDRDTRVGEIIASTSVGKFAYVLGKMLSNFAVLSSFAAILCLDAVAMQLIRGEDRHIDLLAIVVPIAVFVLPVMALISAIGVLFEVLPVLRGGLGNVVYFFLWLGMMTSGAIGSKEATGDAPLDPYGYSAIVHSVWQTLVHVDRHAKPTDVSIITWDTHLNTQTFLYTGMTYTGHIVFQRLELLLVALGIVGVAALAFDRFSSSHRVKAARKPGALASFGATLERAATPLFDLLFASSFGGLVLAELRLMLKGSNFWWYVVQAGLWIWTLSAPGKMQSIALGLAWIWPILIFSQMGTRETLHQTEQLVYPSLHPLRRQFVAQLCAGILLALLAGSGAILHDLLTGNAHGILGILTGATFIPTLALACGALSGTTRVFELLYLMLWYIGPMNAAFLDYTGTTSMTSFASATLVLACAAFYGRSRKLATA